MCYFTSIFLTDNQCIQSVHPYKCQKEEEKREKCLKGQKITQEKPNLGLK